MGEDVAHLQRSLQDLGFAIGDDRLGTYQVGTAQAVAAFYRGANFVPVDAFGNELRDSTNRAAIPLGEAVFIDRFPAFVTDISALRGDIISDEPVLTIASGSLRMTGTVPAADITRIEEGDRGIVELASGSVKVEVTGLPATRRSSATRGGAESEGLSAASTRLQLASVPRLTRDALGESGRLIIIVEQTGRGTLIVPISALRESTDGRTWIDVTTAADHRRVAVSVRLVSGGDVAIDPLGGTLRVGDEVIVGDAGSNF